MTAFFYTNDPYYTWLLSYQRYLSNGYPITTVNPGIGLNYACPGYYRKSYCDVSTKVSKAEVSLMNNMRMLWEQHVAWTRMAIISMVSDNQFLDSHLFY